MIAEMLVVSTGASRGVREERIRYGPHPQQYLLFFQPPPGAVPRRNMVFFLHGGGWRVGNPEAYRFVGRFCARLGFATAMPGYRLTLECRLREQMQDVYGALKTAMEIGRQRRLYQGRIIAGGQSAGGHLAGLLVYDRDGLARQGLRQELFSGFLAISSPLDFSVCRHPVLSWMIDDLAGGAVARDRVDPIRHVAGDEGIPVLCLHGERDQLVDVESSLSFVRRVNRSGQRLAEAVVVAGAHHLQPLRLFWRDAPATGLLARWLQARE